MLLDSENLLRMVCFLGGVLFGLAIGLICGVGLAHKYLEEE